MVKDIRLSVAMVDYEAHVRARGLAQRSVKNKIQPLRRAQVFWGDVSLSRITPAHIDTYFQQGGWSAKTQNMYLGVLREFFKWARHSSYMDLNTDPTFGWGNMKVPKVRRMRLEPEEFYPLLDSAPHPRDRFALAVGLFLMLRGGEIVTLKIKDLNMSDLSIAIYRHKGQDSDVMPVSEELREEAVRWLNWYREDQGTLDPNWYLVPSKKPDVWVPDIATNKYTKSGINASLRPTTMMSHPYRIVQRGLASLGYEIHKEGEHTLRRSGARAYADQLRSEGVDNALMATAAMLGHSDVRITQHYIGWDVERDNRNLSIAGKKLFPGIGSTQTGLHVVKEIHG